MELMVGNHILLLDSIVVALSNSGGYDRLHVRGKASVHHNQGRAAWHVRLSPRNPMDSAYGIVNVAATANRNLRCYLPVIL
jgi:hypothetical protein